MTGTKINIKKHLTNTELADFLSGRLSPENKARIEAHLADCSTCLESMVSCHESVKLFNNKNHPKDKKDNTMKKINIYLVLAILSFTLSFVMPRYFLQFLVATIVLGIKWVVDSKTTKMLVMIHEAWKHGGEKEASRILESLKEKKRF
jgi:hypothetical protein